MLETNIRIIYPGDSIYLLTRQVLLTGTHFTPDIREKCCSKLRRELGVAAVSHPTLENALIVAEKSPINSVQLVDDDWEITVSDSASQDAHEYTLADEYGTSVLPRLFERLLLASLDKRNDLWHITARPRQWYSSEVLQESDDFVAYRRYDIASTYIENIGVGIIIDVGVSFMTKENLAYFFDPNVSQAEQKNRREFFEDLRKRHGDHKGTILYDYGHGKTIGYFAEAPGNTCDTTGMIRVGNQHYDSLYDYYCQKNPKLQIQPDETAIRISMGIEDSKSQWVAARLARLRVMNDDLPIVVRRTADMSPEERKQEILKFWAGLGNSPFGRGRPSVMREGLWQPSNEQSSFVEMPNLVFGQNKILAAPQSVSADAYVQNYRSRLDYLSRYGCYHVNPVMPRTIYCAYPNDLSQKSLEQLAQTFEEQLYRFTKHKITVTLISYYDVADAARQLKDKSDNGVVVFILNDENNAYYEAEYQLSQWRIKRITTETLAEFFEKLEFGSWDRRTQRKSKEKGQRDWANFVEKNSLALLDLLGCIPYRAIEKNTYEAQLVIDVSYDQRYFALSLLINRDEDKYPNTYIDSWVKPKEHHRQTINPVILADEIEDFFNTIKRRNFVPLASMLVVRDGQFFGGEFEQEYQHETEGVDEALVRLKEQGFLAQDAVIDLINLRKDSLKNIRVWQVENGIAQNPFEGTIVALDSRQLVIATTGNPTLSDKVTIQPFIIENFGRCSDLLRAGRACFLGSQFNWASPLVAQRLPQPLKRTDEELTKRMAQEIRQASLA